MNYSQAIEILYNQAPMFQHLGKAAYKTGLETTYRLDEYFNHPHTAYHTIHIAGTNGKGSCSHLTASILQSAGYKVGLYTSPHLRDFRERIRINGEMISQKDVCDFVEASLPLIEQYHPSFFEITTAMAFCYFRAQKVDIAVIEVGLGGRLDCTNIISPLCSLITNISLDHTDLLGATVEDIAREKAGVIKPNTPVVIGEYDKATFPIFKQRALEQSAPLVLASEWAEGKNIPPCQLKGFYQKHNTKSVIALIDQLQKGGVLHISQSDIEEGFATVLEKTNLIGRWQTISYAPRVICDTGHNQAGIEFVVEQLKSEEYDTLRIVIGMVKDKDIDHVLPLLPKNALYYFTNAAIPRALPAAELKQRAASFGLHGEAYHSVKEALAAAKTDAQSGDLIFVGGSNFIVAEIV